MGKLERWRPPSFIVLLGLRLVYERDGLTVRFVDPFSQFVSQRAETEV